MAAEVFAGVGIVLLIIFLALLIPVAIIFLFIFWILMIIDAAQRKFKNENDKVVWIIVVALLNWIGAFIYYFIIKKPNKH